MFTGKCDPSQSQDTQEAEQSMVLAGSRSKAKPAAPQPSPRGTVKGPTRAATAKAANRNDRRQYANSGSRAPVSARKPVQRADLRLTFQTGSANLTPQAREEAMSFARGLQLPAMTSMRFTIEGHTDSQGSRAYNLDLSQRRAAAVVDFLASQGVSRDRLTIRGYGFDKPLPGHSRASPANRRVEAVVQF